MEKIGGKSVRKKLLRYIRQFIVSMFVISVLHCIYIYIYILYIYIYIQCSVALCIYIYIYTVQHAYNEHGYNELTDITKQFLTYRFFPYLFHYKRSCILQTRV